MQKEAIILFTRVPVPGKTKTRLEDFMSPEDCAELQKKLIVKNYTLLKRCGRDLFISYTPDDEIDVLMDLLSKEDHYLPQISGDLGERMFDALRTVLALGYESAVLLGSDIYDMTTQATDASFELLRHNDIALIPTVDGGYCLIGMKQATMVPFRLGHYGDATVYERTVRAMEEAGLGYGSLAPLRDIDTKEDMIAAYLQTDEFSDLGAGEYNRNYFYHKNGTSRVLRINTASQMHLEDQIVYEYEALRILESSGVTPHVYEVDDSRSFFPYGILTMEYLKGRPLDYKRDLETAAYLLSRIHATPIPQPCHLIRVNQPYLAMVEECRAMFAHYCAYENKDHAVEQRILRLFAMIESLGYDDTVQNPAIINTELNSGNFIIGTTPADSYIIDWEKPLIGDAEQDLGHFLAPTTTYWKTDVILSEEERETFLSAYEAHRPYDRKRLLKYLIFTCLRGLTWSSMAYVSYSRNERSIQNATTFKKIKEYLSIDFLESLFLWIDQIGTP